MKAVDVLCGVSGSKVLVIEYLYKSHRDRPLGPASKRAKGPDPLALYLF
jgi:hypothetical protein